LTEAIEDVGKKRAEEAEELVEQSNRNEFDWG
jgi:hypothetical protein